MTGATRAATGRAPVVKGHSSMVTVRLEYGGMRFENDAQETEVAVTAERMAERHRIKISTRLGHRSGQNVPSGGRTELTNARARFTVWDSAGNEWLYL
ncbi:hypothetical protein [Mycolicibacterium sphagni]|uniref:hypothetical protein n=1 Tax=Mycolicibacterium sphagni TaxID=1786 RepID=UPI0021F390E2|nr:hypothetical protein [Mycolicibacterium sphagni]MCV7174852.1 hypothetical protein [Mycolicibacterium sphagni]